MKQISRQKKWQEDQAKAGKCISCGDPSRGFRRCEPCRERNVQTSMRWQKAHPERTRAHQAAFHKKHSGYHRKYYQRLKLSAMKPA